VLDPRRSGRGPAPDPRGAQTPAGFIALLRELKSWSGLTYRQLERQASRAGAVLPYSTIAGALGRNRLPREDLVVALVRACGLDEENTAHWVAARKRLRPDGEPPSREPARAFPAQLPMDVPGFAGRTSELAQLDATLAGVAEEPTTVVISALTGTAGVGKTALAVHWAHRVRRQFGDGQLYVNLRGYDPGPPARPTEVLTSFLHALGVPAEEVPVRLDEAAGLYRSLVADRKMLVLLDNAASAEQVRPLLPGTPGCLVLVTTRDRLPGLVARDGARRLTVDVLSPDEGCRLLAGLLGGDRVTAEPAAAADLVDQCAGLPLAIRIAAAQLADQPGRSLADYTDQLAAEGRLAALRLDSDPHTAVRAAFDLSYDRLEPAQQRLFRLLGLVPGPDLTAEAAAALAETTVHEAGRGLDRLADAHLLVPGPPDRYTWHDLLRDYAADRARTEDSELDRLAAAGRLYDHCLRRADAAARRLYPGMLRLPPATGDGTPQPDDGFADRASALAWLDAERRNLVATIAHTAVNGPHPVAWRLSDTLRGYLWLRMYTVDWLAIASAGMAAAQADHDPAAQAAAQLSLGLLHWRLDQYQQAIDHSSLALELSRRAGWIEGQSAALGNLGGLHLRSGRLDRSAAYQAEALALDRDAGRVDGMAASHVGLGAVYTELGRLREAAEHYIRAIAISEQIGTPGGQAAALVNLGLTRHALGQLTEAADILARALRHSRQAGDRGEEARALLNLAAVRCDAGRQDEALDLAGTAVALARELGSRWMEADALIALATAEHRLDRHREAIDHHTEALRLARDTRNRHTEIDAHLGLAAGYRALGRPGAALVQARRALAPARWAGYRLREGQARTAIATIHLAQCDADRAIQEAEAALAIHRETGHQLGEARTQLLLGHAAAQAGDRAGARVHWSRARRLFEAIGAPEVAQARKLLATRRPRQPHSAGPPAAL
jgi:tetratricopeptide (TPR) repeat protein